MGFLLWLWEFLRSAMQMIIPPSLRPQAYFGTARMGLDKVVKERMITIRRRIAWALHILLVIGVFFLLWWVNYRFDLERVLRSPWPVLHKIWLPLLFLLAYVLLWLGLWLWRMLGPDQESADFPDIEDAWNEGLLALSKAGIVPSEVPLFLLLGRPSGSMDDLFTAAQMSLQVRNVPAGPDAPLRVFASRKGIFVTCEGASLLGRQIELLLDEESAFGKQTIQREGALDDSGTPVVEVTGEPASSEERPVVNREGMLTQVEMMLGEQRQAAPMTIAEFVFKQQQEPTQARKRRQALLKNTEQVELQTARLQYLCRLIGRARRPYCPVNGILVVLPLASTSHDENATQTGAVCRHDLSAAREMLHVHCPVLAVLCDLEKAPGFTEMVQHFPVGEQRQRHVGRPFPLVPHLDPADIPRMIESGIRWLCQTLFPTFVYRLLEVKDTPAEGASKMIQEHSRLFQFLGELRERQNRMTLLLTHGIAVSDSGPSLFGGCFLAATGPDVATQQAFANGVFRLMLDNQSLVSWTDAALAEEADYRRLTRYCYIGTILLAVALMALVYYFWLS